MTIPMVISADTTNIFVGINNDISKLIIATLIILYLNLDSSIFLICFIVSSINKITKSIEISSNEFIKINQGGIDNDM